MLRLLGEGGMGQVFLAEDESLERKVAIKMIAPRLAGEGPARARFLREARAMAGIEHPHVVRVYAFGESEGQAYFVMEYVEGETLAARLKRVARLAVADALRIGRETAQALAAAWARGVVHRDVKPANILLDRDDQVKVADFGLARIAAASDADQTGSGVVVGTPHYVSPEQARGEPTDFRSDVYSLGVVLYEMLGGQKPFTGQSPVEVMARQISEPLPPLRERRPDVPGGVAQLVDWMTSKSPAARPTSYAELLSRLTPESASGPLESPATATSTMPTPARPASPKHRRLGRRGVPLLLAAVAAVMAGITGYSHLSPRRPAFSVAVAPFFGPDAESESEGRLFASLIESELLRQIPDEGAVLGPDNMRKPPRSARSARALAEELGVNVVVWGEAFALRDEVELVAQVTRRDTGSVDAEATPAAPLPTGAGGIEARRARASAIARRVAALSASASERP
jgi:serine/threonine protein kinase